MVELRTGPWKLSELKNVPQNGLKVFSCFHCGGGSTMGYKLAGYTVLGGVEIDPQIMAIYRKNHNPKHSYLMGVQEFKTIPDEQLPPELFNLDILDGSPPCSTFSTAGAREKKWGKEHHFREGQAKQVLDDLFFQFIDVAAKLKPKVVVAENVRGLILGNARGYVKEIFAAFREAGYEAQLFLLNAAAMGVPQKRERTFFIARKKGLFAPMTMRFDEKPIPFKRIKYGNDGPKLSELALSIWNNRKSSDMGFDSINERLRGKRSNFNTKIIHDNLPMFTIAASCKHVLFSEPRFINDVEMIRGQSFPDDYDFLKTSVMYLCGMSVPPFMMQRVADQIARQWFGANQ